MPKTKPNTPKNTKPHSTQAKTLPKSLTGIQGLDDITHGGIPKDRATLVCGGTGTGKTILAMEFLYRGTPTMNPAVLEGITGIAS